MRRPPASRALALVLTGAATLLAPLPLSAPATAASASTATPHTSPTAPAHGLAIAVPQRRAATSRPIAYTGWDTSRQLRRGARAGTVVSHGRVVLDHGVAVRRADGLTYDAATWTSPWVSPGFGLTQLVSSWAAQTPGSSWIEVSVRGEDATGRLSSWDVLGRWARGDGFVPRTSVSGQSDDLASVDVDTWRSASSSGLTSWQLQVTLFQKQGATTGAPSLDSVGAMASRLPSTLPPTSRPSGVAEGTVLPVPRYSQMVHDGDYSQWGGGGEAWCSPTSTSMVLGYYDALPAPASYAWVPKGHPAPWVDYAARATYDHAYDGTGNWPFNTAYAASLAGHAFVTRLRSLREAEQFIAAGIPLVASISFGSGQLSGAPISASNGHLVVIRGFTDSGDVVVNDPAAQSAAGVRRVYDRGQLERAWLGRSGGLVYVIRDDTHPLPAGTHSNW